MALIHYCANWILSRGCVPVDNMMEDAATSEVRCSLPFPPISSPFNITSYILLTLPLLFPSPDLSSSALVLVLPWLIDCRRHEDHASLRRANHCRGGHRRQSNGTRCSSDRSLRAILDLAGQVKDLVRLPDVGFDVRSSCLRLLFCDDCSHTDSSHLFDFISFPCAFAGLIFRTTQEQLPLPPSSNQVDSP